MKKFLVFALVAMFASMAMAQYNYVLNPGFEDGVTDEHWQPENWFRDDNVWRNDANPRTGSWHLSIDASRDPAAAQTIGGLSHLQGLDITASAWVEVVGGDGGNVFFGANQQTGTGDFISNHESAGIFEGWDNTDSYPNNPTLEFEGAATLGQIELYFRSDEVAGRRFDIDDVSLTAIPEPATMSLLGLGALAMVLRRKIRK